MENRWSKSEQQAFLQRSNISYTLDKLRGGPFVGLLLYPVLATSHRDPFFAFFFGSVALTHAVNFGGTFWNRERQGDDRVIYNRAALSYALAPWLLLLVPGALTSLGLKLIFPVICVTLITAYFVGVGRFDLRSAAFRLRFLLGAAVVWAAIGIAALVVLGLIGSRAVDFPDEAKTAAVFVGPLTMAIAFLAAKGLLTFSRSAADHRLAWPGVAAGDLRPGWVVAMQGGDRTPPATNAAG